MQLIASLSRTTALVLPLASLFLFTGCNCGPEHTDGDGDGFSQAEGDCDDGQAAIYPGAAETCNGLDDDCDSNIDEDFDADGDGAFDIDACADGTDCDDSDAAFNPDAVELCDGLDNDCDGVADNGLTPQLWCEDNDGDGVGSDVSVELCEETAPIGYVVCPTADFDCDDGNGSVFPGATEACNGIDDDCNGTADFDAAGEVDVDGDTALSCDDCDDTEATAFPGNPEVCDGIDNDCNGSADFSNADGGEVDVDEDGFLACAECNDGAAPIYPGAAEVCDALDSDCDGNVDSTELDDDSDGWIDCADFVPNGAVGIFGGDDCDDGDDEINPGATEVCDGTNEDCDDLTDEDFDVDGDGYYDENDSGCAAVYVQDQLDCDDAVHTVHYEAPEACDGIDNDCDGLVDAADGDFGGADTDGDGEEGIDCGGIDCNDGDPLIYAGFSVDSDGITPCGGDCDDYDPYVKPSQPEACDGVDTDCDGLVDDADPDLATDWDGDGQDAAGCGIGGTDCDDRDRHVFDTPLYTSGVVPSCQPAVYPGFAHDWHYGRISLPSYFADPVSGLNYIYYRGHKDQTEQQIGVSSSADGVVWTAHPNPVLDDAGDTAGWDFRNLSNPSVAYVPGLSRPYVMLYHARAASGGLRQIGLATATDPLGPFERLDPNTGAALSAPVIAESSDPAALDSSRVLHPSIHFDGTELHAWYNGRQASPNTLRVFHATSTDGGVTWTKTDDNGDTLPDAIFEPTEPWHGSSVSQVSWLEDPFTTGEFEFWYTASSTQVGYTTGDATNWDIGVTDPVLTVASDCTRMDGFGVSARGIRYDAAIDAYHWLYGAQTDTGDVNNPGTCAGNNANYETDPLWNNGLYISYVAQGTNYAPSVTLTTPLFAASSMVFDGTVTDTAPDDGTLVVAVTSDLDGFLGTATIASTGNTDSTVQSTTWSLSVTGLSSGSHGITVDAVDGAGTARSISSSVTIP